MENEHLNDLLVQLAHAEAELASYSMTVKNLKSEIVDLHKDAIADALRQKDEPFGTVDIGSIKFTVPKKVEWNQAKLEQVYRDIGATAGEYIKIKYDVPEAKYKSWPEAIRREFDFARTTKAGSITFKLKDAE